VSLLQFVWTPNEKEYSMTKLISIFKTELSKTQNTVANNVIQNGGRIYTKIAGEFVCKLAAHKSIT